ncbi:Protein of unknown function [Gryllus bimaculatus]|nr:Protein of unknown function [Gryllus bimaculatus]
MEKVRPVSPSGREVYQRVACPQHDKEKKIARSGAQESVIKQQTIQSIQRQGYRWFNAATGHIDLLACRFASQRCPVTMHGNF